MAVVDAQLFDILSREDNWVEYLTPVWFLLTGLLLFATALAERSIVRRSIYLLCGVAFLFAAGEEISWGQRILGFATPDFLLDWNDQDEFNVHNISNSTFRRVYRQGTLLLCLVTGAAFFCRKDALFRIPLPSVVLVLGFLMVLSYRPLAVNVLSSSFSDFITDSGKALLLLLVIYTALSGQRKLLIASAVTILFVVAFSYVNYHIAVRFVGEVREYLFGIICFCYACELLLAQVRSGALSRMSFVGRQMTAIFPLRLCRLEFPDLRSSGNDGFPKAFWLAVCSLIIAGSIGLVLLQYFSVRAEVADIEERYRSIVAGTAGEPIIRATFDAYLIGSELIYFKEPCDLADTEDRFFLHLIPTNMDDLPAMRRQHGFDNLDFN